MGGAECPPIRDSAVHRCDEWEDIGTQSIARATETPAVSGRDLPPLGIPKRRLVARWCPADSSRAKVKAGEPGTRSSGSTGTNLGPSTKETTVTNERTGRWVGTLMLLHLALGLIGPYVVLVPMTAPPGGFLEKAAAMEIAARVSVLILIVGALIPMLMAVAAWRIWRARSPAFSRWLLTLAGVNLALQLVENAHWLTMLSVSQAHQAAGAEATGAYEVVAIAVLQAFRWAHYGHILVLVSWILVLFAALGGARLLPRWLARLGMAASVVHLMGIPYGRPLGDALGLRIRRRGMPAYCERLSR